MTVPTSILGDVVYTYRRLLDPQVGSAAIAVLSPFLKSEGIEAVDLHTVRFKLTRPIAEFPVLQREKLMQIVKEGTPSEELRLKGNGTGPFVLEQFTPGAPVRILRRNKNYWQPGLPKAECLRITVIQEATSRIAAVLSGETDLLLNVDPASLITLKNNPNVELIRTPGATGYNLAMWVYTAPFNDVRVRQAMKHVVDRQAMLDTVLLGYGELGSDTPVPPSSPPLSAKRSQREISRKQNSFWQKPATETGCQSTYIPAKPIPARYSLPLLTPKWPLTPELR